MNLRRFTIFAACLAAGTCGFWLARSNANTLGAPEPTDSNSRVSESHSESVTNARKARLEKTSATKDRSPAQLAALKKEIMRNFANSPSPEHDWALRSQTAAWLATMSDQELEHFISGLLPPKNEMISSEDWRLALIKQIYQAWGLRNPAAACDSVTNGWNLGSDTFDDWLRRDPEAAADFAEKQITGSGTNPLAKSMQWSLLNQQALTDLPVAIRSADSLDPTVRQSMLISWTRMFANDPAKREELVDLITSMNDSKVSETCLKSLIGEFSERSPSEAAAFVESLEVSESLKDELSHEVIGKWARKDPKQAFGAWIERGETKVPAPLMRAMDGWSLNFPGVTESIEWVEGLEPGPVKEQFKNHMVGHLATFERFAESAKLSTSIADPTERIRQMKLVKRIWEESHPKNANEWLSKLPPEDQTAVENPLESSDGQE